MRKYKSFSEVARAIRAAKTFEEIVDIFYQIGLLKAKWTPYLIEKSKAMEEAIKRLTPYNPSNTDLYDFWQEYCDIATNVDIAIEKKEDRQFQELIHKASQITIETVKRELMQNGEALKKKIGFEESLQIMTSAKQELEEQEEKWDSDDFNAMHGVMAELVKKYYHIDESDYEDAGNNEESVKDWIDNREVIKTIDGETIKFAVENGEDNLFQLNQLKKIFNLTKEHIHEIKEVYPEYVDLYDNICKNRYVLKKNSASILMSKISVALSDSSGISVEDAIDWAQKNVFFDNGVEERLKSIGYPKEQLLEDTADFYRYVGGKLGAINFITSQEDRASAHLESMQIEITEGFSKKDLFHECGHFVESIDKTALECSKNFIEKRATGSAESLRNLTGDVRFAPDERAYPNHFIDPYVGKIYDNASEVFSMAIEQMHNPELFIKFAVKDTEHFNLFLGDCLHNNPEIKKYAQQIRDQIRIKNKKLNHK